jgi:serine/threonine protein kinase
MHHVHSKPEPLPEEYEYLQPVLDRLLAKNPHERYSCFEEVSNVLEGYIELYS